MSLVYFFYSVVHTIMSYPRLSNQICVYDAAILNFRLNKGTNSVFSLAYRIAFDALTLPTAITCCVKFTSCMVSVYAESTWEGAT